MADEDPVRLSSTPSSRSSLSSGSEEIQSSTIDLVSGVSPRKVNSGFQCKLCTLVASSQSALDEHMNIHTGSRPYQCLECGFSCSLQSTLTQHLAVHRVEMSSSVLMRSPSVEEMQKSPRDQPPSLYPEVPRTLSLPSTAPMIHSEELIPVPAPVGVFPDQSRIFQCKLCTHISPTKTHLNEHMNIHSGKKPYKCLVCGFSSAFRSSLMRHLIVHTGTSKQFKCDQCHYQTPYKCNLQAHRRKRHNSVENVEIPETTVSGPMPEISKVSTPNSNHSDDSQSGMGIYPSSDMSVSFPYGHTSQSMVSDHDHIQNGPSDDQQEEAQETNTSGTTEVIAGTENGFTGNPSAQPLQVSVPAEDAGVTKSSPGSGSGSTPSLEQTYGTDTTHMSSSPVRENGEVSEMGGLGLVSSHGPSSTSASPITSLCQMAGNHSPLVQTSVNENLPVTSMMPTSSGFPIYIRKNREEKGAKKRKQAKVTKRDRFSPDKEMWIDTRSVTENQRPFFINVPGTNMKSDDEGVIYHDQNGLDLTTPQKEGVRSASADGLLNNHNSPVGASGIAHEDGEEKHLYPFHIYHPQVGIRGRPYTKVSTGTQTDTMAGKEKADGQSQGNLQLRSDIPPQASKCPHCETYFTDQVMFTLHMSCHGQIHPFQCGICGYMCGDKIEFTCHITRSKHLR